MEAITEVINIRMLSQGCQVLAVTAFAIPAADNNLLNKLASDELDCRHTVPITQTQRANPRLTPLQRLLPLRGRNGLQYSSSVSRFTILMRSSSYRGRADGRLHHPPGFYMQGAIPSGAGTSRCPYTAQTEEPS